jgi:hypothetical protein
MNDIVVGARLHLLDLPAIVAVVAQRIYAPILPQKVTYPAIQLQLISDIERPHLRGPDGCPRVRLQVDCWALTRDAAASLGRLCRARLHGFAGTWTGDRSGSPASTLRILCVALDLAQEIFEAEVMGGMCRHSADYYVTFQDATETMLTT